MKMQDKEFDQLFNARFADFEAEPTEGLWDKIAAEIPANGEVAPVKKRSLSPFIQIAAGLIVVLAAGLLFMPSAPKIVLHGNYSADDQPKAVKQPDVSADSLNVFRPDPAQAVQSQTTQLADHPAKAIAVNNIEKTTADEPVDTLQNIIASTNMKPENRGVINTPAIPVTNAVAYTSPKEDVPTKPVKVIAVANIPQQPATPVVKKKKIRGLGDLLNVVIAKVDKRDNKAIVFGSSGDDDDDGLLNVTSVNLGFIKVKKQN